MDEMCPKCGAPLQVLIVDDGLKSGPIRWCIVCTYTSEQPAVIRSVVESNPRAFVHFRAMSRGAFNELDWKQWELFEELFANAEHGGVLLTEAYREARANPGQWITTAPIVNRMQLLRGLLGLSWKPCEPPVAVRCHPDGSSDFAKNAYKVVSARQTKPSWWDLVSRSWGVQWIDPMSKRRGRHAE